jgi:hypothetical protein
MHRGFPLAAVLAALWYSSNAMAQTTERIPIPTDRGMSQDDSEFRAALDREYGPPVDHAREDAVAACVLRHAPKLQHIHGNSGWAPLTWLIGQCRRNHNLRG